MAKKTLGDILKIVFGSKLDEEIDLEDKEDTTKKDESTVSDKEDKNKTDTNKEDNKVETHEDKDEKIDKKENTDTEDKVSNKVFEDGWFDSTSKKINFDKIKSEEALTAIKTLTDMYKQERDARLIEDSLNDNLKNYSLNVSTDTLRKVLNVSDVKINENGEVVGIKEAIEALKTSEPGFFKDKDKESNPLNEGFDPVEKPTAPTEEELVNLAYAPKPEEN